MKARTKSFLGVISTCIGGGLVILFSSRYFNISADSVSPGNESNYGIFLIASIIIALLGIVLLVLTIIDDKKERG
ncbi:MAG: hypothetical protein WC080_04360 [Patescibacteria group bacterium]|jgi:hypothetical protein